MKILLHVCCGCCLSGVMDRLRDYSVTLFFSNSNIDSKSEFEKRYLEAQKLALKYDLKIIKDTYDHASWLEFIKGLENEEERGERCSKCFEFNLRRTAIKAKELSLDAFTTTLTISPHKDSKKIFSIGNSISSEIGVEFLEVNFKKEDGFKKSLCKSKELGLYRQNYCGCEFSFRSNVASPKE